MNALKSLLAVSVLAAAGVASASTVQTYTVTTAVTQPVLYSTQDQSGNPVTYTLASNITGGGTATLDSSGVLLLNLSSHAQLDITAVVNSALPPGSLYSDTITTSTLTLATTGAYSLNKTGSSTTTLTCTNGPTDAVGSCNNITLNSPAALFGAASYYSSQGFTLSGGSFNIKSLNAGANVVTTYTLTAAAAPAVPVPAAAWLFGSSLLGLAGAARRRAA